MLLTYQNECVQTMVPILLHAHTSFQDNNMPGIDSTSLFTSYFYHTTNPNKVARISPFGSALYFIAPSEIAITGTRKNNP